MKTIYSSTIKLWPKENDVSDAKMLGDFGMRTSILWNAFEMSDSNAADDWQTLMDWVLYQQLRDMTRNLLKTENRTLFLSEIDKSELERRYFEALNNKGWEICLKNYLR